jgi:hypothetical protein
MARKPKPLSQPPVWLLSLDPAAAAGYCLFHESKPHAWGAADGSSWSTLITQLGLVQTCIASGGKVEGVIEEGFFQFGKQTFKGALTLGRRRGLAQAAAEWCGVHKFTYIVPSTWQNGLGWRKGQDTKEWSVAYVKQRWGIDDITHDVADSIALGSYYIDNYAEFN